MRSEQKFESVDALKKQLDKDKITALAIIKKL
jgi:FAD synthase